MKCLDVGRLTQTIINLGYQRPSRYESIQQRDRNERWSAERMAVELVTEYVRLSPVFEHPKLGVVDISKGRRE